MRAVRAAFVIGWVTFLEAIRNRILVVVLMLSIALTILSIAVAAVSIGERARLIIDVGLAAASAIGSLVAVALTIASFGREIERRTAYPILARPLRRSTFVLGKYLGLLATMGTVVTLVLVATAASVWLYGDRPPAAFWPSFWLSWLEMALVIAVALLFSTYTTPVLASAYVVAILIAGNLVGDLSGFADRLSVNGEVLTSFVLRVFYWILPNLQALSLRTQAANSLPVPPAFIGWATLYALTYAAAALALAMILFERRKSI